MEYKRLKTPIAKKWINSGEAMVELISLASRLLAVKKRGQRRKE